MALKTITLANGRQISFEIGLKPGRGIHYVLGVRKSGSSILNSICNALAKHNDFIYVDVAGTFFDQNVITRAWHRDIAINDLLAEGNVYGGFRDMPFAFASDARFAQARKILLVRDPRDALVSEYFSNAYSHSIPTATETHSDVTRQIEAKRETALTASIDKAVLDMAEGINNTLLDYENVKNDPNTLVLKYEDVILDKQGLVGKICGHFDWTVSAGFLQGILSWADKVPKTEDPKSFIRKVVPGDHIEKLRPQTIASLNQKLKSSMDLFGYAAK